MGLNSFEIRLYTKVIANTEISLDFGIFQINKPTNYIFLRR